jgi:hypothetical protein
MPPPKKIQIPPEDFPESIPDAPIPNPQETQILISHEEQIEKIQQYAHNSLLRIRQDYSTNSLENSRYKSQTPESSPDKYCDYTQDGDNDPNSVNDDDDDDDYYIDGCPD